jgi:hypothetical protein
MATNWDEVQRVIYPMKDYEDLCRRLQASFSFPFVRSNFNFGLPQLQDYVQQLLGGDARGRYGDYLDALTAIIARLDQAGVADLLSLVEQTASRGQMERFTGQSEVPAEQVAILLKFAVYWLIPTEKYLGGLVRDLKPVARELEALKAIGVKTNLHILERGSTLAGREEMAAASGLPVEVITQWVNRADFSRLPWASKATVSNLMGSGYGSIAQLANGHLEQVVADYMRYGQSIDKNLKLGNEVENSYRIARIVPHLVQG